MGTLDFSLPKPWIVYVHANPPKVFSFFFLYFFLSLFKMEEDYQKLLETLAFKEVFIRFPYWV